MRTLAALLAVALSTMHVTPPPEPVAAAPFRVMTFNLRYGTAADGPDHWCRRREFVADTIRRHAPAILGVQEALAFQLEYLAAGLPHHRRLGVGRDADGGGEASVLFVDTRRFEVVADGTFWLSPTPDVKGSVGWDAALPRICTWAELRDRETGASLRVWNTHLDHRGALAREHGAALIAARATAEPLPDVVLGDLNSGERDAAIAALRGSGLRDSFRVVHPTARDVGTFNGFGKSVATGAKIDYVWVDARIDVRDAAIDRMTYAGRHASDHDAVVADLAWPTEDAR